MTNRVLRRDFYARNTSVVARALLGKVLVTGYGTPQMTGGMIVETEAYPGGDDLASHSAAGITPRTRVIFEEPGHAYVYLSYGIHVCMNIVAEPKGEAGCVLVRALEPVEGLDLMRKRRGVQREHDLASGPGKLTEALGITLENYGDDLTQGSFVVCEPPEPRRFQIRTTRRIGISKCVERPLRFLIRGNAFVSGRK